MPKHPLFFKMLVVGTLFAIPATVLAQAPGTIADLIGKVVYLILLAIPVVIGFAMLVFFWGLANFILRANSPEAREKGKTLIVWGSIVFFVMISVWGIVEVIRNTFF